MYLCMCMYVFMYKISVVHNNDLKYDIYNRFNSYLIYDYWLIKIKQRIINTLNKTLDIIINRWSLYDKSIEILYVVE